MAIDDTLPEACYERIESLGLTRQEAATFRRAWAAQLNELICEQFGCVHSPFDKSIAYLAYAYLNLERFQNKCGSGTPHDIWHKLDLDRDFQNENKHVRELCHLIMNDKEAIRAHAKRIAVKIKAGIKSPIQSR
jgi:hypothetical protein